MIRAWVVFIVLIGLVLWAAFTLIKKRKVQIAPSWPRLAAPAKSNDIWSQLYETDSLDELVSIRLRLNEEDLSFIAYEQGKRDLEGKAPKKFGIAMPKGHLSRGQNILARVLS